MVETGEGWKRMEVGRFGSGALDGSLLKGEWERCGWEGVRGEGREVQGEMSIIYRPSSPPTT